MPACLGCGSHVTVRFARVLGDNDDQAHRCPRCAGGTAVENGAAAGADLDDASSAVHALQTPEANND